MFKTLQALFLSALGVFTTVPMIVKPEAPVVAAGQAAYSVTTLAPKLAQAEKAPEFNPAPTPGVDDAPVAPVTPAPDSTPVGSGCCIDCKCKGDCHCTYPGECVLKAAGKDIIWFHCETTGAWRGYATPRCKDVRELKKDYQHPQYNTKGQLLAPTQQRRILFRGSCGPNGCSVN